MFITQLYSLSLIFSSVENKNYDKNYAKLDCVSNSFHPARIVFYSFAYHSFQISLSLQKSCNSPTFFMHVNMIKTTLVVTSFHYHSWYLILNLMVHHKIAHKARHKLNWLSSFIFNFVELKQITLIDQLNKNKQILQQ